MTAKSKQHYIKDNFVFALQVWRKKWKKLFFFAISKHCNGNGRKQAEILNNRTHKCMHTSVVLALFLHAMQRIHCWKSCFVRKWKKSKEAVYSASRVSNKATAACLHWQRLEQGIKQMSRWVGTMKEDFNKILHLLLPLCWWLHNCLLRASMPLSNFASTAGCRCCASSQHICVSALCATLTTSSRAA